ncbi:serine/threonine-protein kinase Nek4-like [Branchiostoma lanceolatum]|uniref:serine/threonine-protein kinase Nek4-like n=1 Tax=Branchiostoma lanceolatum TaxID=7740 RepID=UPI003452B018
MGLEEYQKVQVVGKGSYGEVWLSRHQKDRKQYVLKRMDLQNASKRERKAAEQEAKLLSKLRHPNIVNYKDSFETEEGMLYIAMGFCEGGDLYTRLKNQKGVLLEEEQVVEWFVQITMALQYLHERNILHRDLKTQNIFLTKTKIIKVGDLGIARVLDSSSDMATTLIGTPYYMSPELFSNKPYNHKSDIWALGCCVYEMATLKHAFNAKDMNSLVYKILRGKMPSMPKKYSTDLCDLIKLMLAQDPEKRPSSKRVLRNPYIKTHIALFLEGTRRMQRPRSSGSRPGSGSRQAVPPSPQKSDTPDGQMMGSIATVSKVDFEVQDVPDTPGVAVSPDLETIEEKSPPPTEQNVKQPARQTPVPTPGSEEPSKHKQRRRKKKEADSDSVNSVDSVTSDSSSSRSSVFDKPKAVQKPRPLPPPPHSDETPKRRPRSGDKHTKGPSVESSSGYSSVSSSKEDADTPRQSINKSARARRREKVKQEVQLSPLVHNRRSSGERPRTGGDRPKDETDSVVAPRRRAHSDCGGSGDGRPYSAGTKSSQDSSEEDDEVDSQSSNEGKKKKESEMNNFICLLDTTLKMQDGKDEEDDSPRDGEEALPMEEVPTPQPPAQSPAPSMSPGLETISASGRLMNRIAALRKDCIKGLGMGVLKKAYDILDTVDGEEVEPQLVELLGKEKFDMYAGKVWQLKFCEDSMMGLL